MVAQHVRCVEIFTPNVLLVPGGGARTLNNAHTQAEGFGGGPALVKANQEILEHNRLIERKLDALIDQISKS